MKTRGLATLAVTLSVAGTACGTASHTAALAGATPTPTTTPSSATHTPPPPPLLIVEQGNATGNVIEAIDAQGTVHWSFNPTTLAGKNAYSQPVVAGSHVLFIDNAGAVTVVDRGGAVVGRGSAAPQTWTAPKIHPDPTGTRWAWATADQHPNGVDGSTAAADMWSGSIWIAGIGEAPHRVLNWREPSQLQMDVMLWSDRGIVTGVVESGCGDAGELSDAILDPATGTSTPLPGGNRHVVDVHAGLVVATRPPETLLVSGTVNATVTPPPAPQYEIVGYDGARISPDGRHVAMSLTSQTGCGGPPTVRTLLFDTATRQTSILTGVYALDWYDDGHLVVGGGEGSALRIVGLSGDGDPAPLTHGNLIGVLR